MNIRVLLTALFISLLVGCTTLTPITSEQAEFNQVFEAPNYSSDQIYTAVRVWIAQNLKSSKSVIEMYSKEEGLIIGNGVIAYPCSGKKCLTKDNWTVPFTMRVDIKDAKFKVSFSNLRLSWPPTYSITTGSKSGFDGQINTQADLDAVKPKLLAFGDEILQSMTEDTTNTTDSDW